VAFSPFQRILAQLRPRSPSGASFFQKNMEFYKISLCNMEKMGYTKMEQP
jgi:hypothetical protein